MRCALISTSLAPGSTYMYIYNCIKPSPSSKPDCIHVHVVIQQLSGVMWMVAFNTSSYNYIMYMHIALVRALYLCSSASNFLSSSALHVQCTCTCSIYTHALISFECLYVLRVPHCAMYMYST